MAETRSLNPHPPEFERFLYAPVGEDRNGYVVTVLSAFARLGLDPWTETAELVTLGRKAARARLDDLFSRFRDVPALGNDHDKVARELSALLPDRRSSDSARQAVSSATKGRLGAIGLIVTLALIVAQFLSGGAPGSGE